MTWKTRGVPGFVITTFDTEGTVTLSCCLLAKEWHVILGYSALLCPTALAVKLPYQLERERLNHFSRYVLSLQINYFVSMMFLSCLVCSHLTKTSIGFRAIQVSHFDHLSYAQQGWLLKLSCNSIRSFSYLLIHILLNHNSFDRFGGVILFVSSKCKRAKIGCSLSARSWFCTLDAYTENDRGFCHMVKSQPFPCMIRVHSACLTSDCLSVCLCSSCSVACCPLKWGDEDIFSP